MIVGQLQQQREGYKAFIPVPFPHKELLDFSAETISKHSEAIRLVGKLDGITQLLPDVNFFIFMYIRKDAASSNQIEGTRATIIDAIEAEANISSDLPEDVDDIIHYIATLNYGMERLKEFPICLRFIRELHKEMMKDARKTQFADPGEFRKSQNWIGGTAPSNAHYVPPPVYEMNQALNDFEKFFHSKDIIPPLIKIALIHSQFEIIHPFLDGNGRTGRLLITLYLWLEKLLDKPVLFLSSYFRKYQQTYYNKLDDYSNGDVDKWLNFFLDGIIETADQAIKIVRKITIIREEDINKVRSLGKTASKSAALVLPELFKLPIVNLSKIKEWTGFTRYGAYKVVDRFIDLGILELKDETKKYNKTYIYRRYVNIFTD